MNPPLEAVIFDVAGVIVDWRGQRALEGLYPASEVEDFFAPGSPWASINHLADAGLSLADSQKKMQAQFPEHATKYGEYVSRFARTVTGPIPGTTELIRHLRKQGVPVYGLSNWSAENFIQARYAAPVLDELDDLIVSGEVGLAKPDPAIYELAVTRFGVQPTRTAFVDDTMANLDAAAPLGFQTFHFTGASGLRDKLLPRLGNVTAGR